MTHEPHNPEPPAPITEGEAHRRYLEAHQRYLDSAYEQKAAPLPLVLLWIVGVLVLVGIIIWSVA